MDRLSTPPQISVESSSRFRATQRRMVFITMCCYLFYYTGRQNFGFITKALQEDLHLSATAIGTITAGLLLAYGCGQAINGALGDRFGARYVVSVGAFLSVALNWATSFGASYSGIFVPWVANGFAQSLGWAPSCRLIANWSSSRERGRAFGFLLLAAGLSSVLTFALCILTLQHLGWRWVLRLPVLTLAVGGALFLMLARNRPEDAGFQSPASDRDTAPESGATDTMAAKYQTVLRNRSFLIASFSIGCESIARYGLLYWVPVHFLGRNWRQDPSSAWITLALPAGMALGALGTGHLSDTIFRGNRVRPIALSLGLASVAALALAIIPISNWSAGCVMLGLCGFLVYGPQAAYWAICPDLVGRERAGTAVGIMDASAYAFAAAGEILIGRTIDMTGRTASAFYVVSAFCLLGAFSILLVRNDKA